MPKVFIIWSGTKSQAVATALADWLPIMLNSIDPFLSTDNLQKGGRWGADLATQLEQSIFGILCLTPDNLNAPWIMFEAGALSKLVTDSHVAPFLVGVKPSELHGPLAQFNATSNEKEDFRRLLKSINTASGPTALKEETLNRAFDGVWPSLQDALSKIEIHQPEALKAGSVTNAEKVDAILQELLTLSRYQSSVLKASEAFQVSASNRSISARSVIRPDSKAWTDLIGGLDKLGSTINDLDDIFEKLPLFESLRSLIVPVEYVLRKSSIKQEFCGEFEGVKLRLKESIDEIDEEIRKISPEAESEKIILSRPAT